MKRIRTTTSTLMAATCLIACQLAVLRYVYGLADRKLVSEYVLFPVIGLSPLAVAVLASSGLAVGHLARYGRGGPFSVGFASSGLIALVVTILVCLFAPMSVWAYVERAYPFAELPVAIPISLFESEIRESSPEFRFLRLPFGLGVCLSGPCLLFAWVGGYLSRRFGVVVTRLA